MLLTEAGGLRRVPLAQFGAVGHVPALQDESSMAAVVKRGALHRRPGGLRRHPAVLQGRPHSGAELHWKPARRSVTRVKWPNRTPLAGKSSLIAMIQKLNREQCDIIMAKNKPEFFLFECFALLGCFYS